MSWMPRAGQIAFCASAKPMGLFTFFMCTILLLKMNLCGNFNDEMMLQSKNHDKNFLAQMIDEYYKRREF